MSTLIQELPTRNHWVADGVQTIWNFSFAGGYISRDHVKAYRENTAIPPVRTDIVITADMFVGDFQLNITPAVPNLHTLVIYRDSSNNGLPLVDFADASDVNELSLDTVAKQSVFVAAEAADFIGVTSSSDLQELAQSASASAASATASATNAAASATTAASSAAAAASSASSSATSAANAAAVATVAVNSFKTELASGTDAAKGAGFVGFVYSLGYAAGTIGKWLKDLANSAGASFIGWIASGTGAILRTTQDKLRDTVNIKDFGATGDGGTDDTVALQAAITAARAQGGDSRTLFWRKGNYRVTNNLVIGTNQHIIFEPGVVINATGLPNETTSLFTISNQVNVTLEGNGCTINGARATAVVEGSSAAFYVYGSDNVLIRDFNIAGFATDGITLTGDNGASGPCTNVRIVGCDCADNRRNGLSIIHAIGVVVTGGRYWNSNGAPNGPHAGIDVEPNENQVCQNILIQGVRTKDNAGPGLLIVPSLQSASVGTEFDVTIKGYWSQNDGALSGMPALRFANGGALTNKVLGQVVVDSAIIVNSKAMGVGFTNWDADKAPRAVLRNVTVINPDGTASASGNTNRTGFVVYCETAHATSNQGNIVFENCYAEDTRGTPRMPWGFLLEADATKTLKNIRVRNPKSVNFVASSKFDVNVGATLNGGCTDVDVTYDSPVLVAAIASAAVGQWAGKRITAQTGGNAYTLPLLSKSIGAHYELFAPSSLGSSVSFLAQAGENIKANGVAAANSLAVAPGDCWRVWNPNGLQWVARAES